MNYFLFFSGLILILIAIYDIIFTALSPSGAGFFTDTITKIAYGFFRSVGKRTNSKRILESAGTLVIIMVLVIWYMTVWLGSSLVMCSDYDSVVKSNTGTPATVVDKFYYTGFTLSTLGIGDYNASTEAWRIFTIFLSFTGFALITTGISYMVPVLSAAVNQRRIGTYISVLGKSPQDILVKHWEGNDFKGLENHLASLTEMVSMHSQQMLAYPVLYCFYTADIRKAGLLNLLKIDELLTILLLNIPPRYRPSDQKIYPLREAISYYLEIRERYISKRDTQIPDIPDMEKLEESGVPLLHDQESLHEAYREFSERRKLINTVLKDQGREFRDIFDE